MWLAVEVVMIVSVVADGGWMVVVVVVVAAIVKVVLSSWDLSSGLLYDCSHQLCYLVNNRLDVVPSVAS